MSFWGAGGRGDGCGRKARVSFVLGRKGGGRGPRLFVG